MLAKPPKCNNCSLCRIGAGFSRPDGTGRNGVLLLGEALGQTEALTGVPFQGQAGAQLNRILARERLKRQDFVIDNCVRCKPPNNHLWGASYFYDAINNCDYYYKQTISNYRPKVVVPMGNTGLWKLTEHDSGITYHRGYVYDVIDLANGTYHVIPTFHPSYVMQGNQNLATIVGLDIKKAIRIAKEGYSPIERTYILDPGVEEIVGYIERAREAASQGCWMAADIETVTSATKDEEQFDSIEDSVITRISFAYKSDEAISIEWKPELEPYIKQLLSLEFEYYVYWNARFDVPRLNTHLGMDCWPKALDAMWMWHFLQSDVPKGLAFVAPIYTDLREWKSLSQEAPALYNCIDSAATIEIAQKVKAELEQEGRFKRFIEHVVELEPLILKMSSVGIKQDQEAKQKLDQKLTKKLSELNTKLQQLVPDEAKPLIKRKILKAECLCPRCKGIGKEPDKQKLKAYGFTLKRFSEAEIVPMLFLDSACKRCKGEGTITRNVKPSDHSGSLDGYTNSGNYWVKRGEFLANSSQHMMEYFSYKMKEAIDKGRLGKKWEIPLNHKTKRETMDEKVLKSHKSDPVCSLVLEIRKLNKSKSQYINGFEANESGRIATEFTYKPSTWRFASQNPNVQNIPNPKRTSDPAEAQTAREIRNLYVASPGNILAAIDYTGIEAFLTSIWAKDEQYKRASALGIHAILASYPLAEEGKVEKPISLELSDDEIKQLVKHIKKEFPFDYNRAKPITHGSAYGGTGYKFKMEFPELFKSIKEANELQRILFTEIAPRLHVWQWETILEAHLNGYIDSVFDYRHYYNAALHISYTCRGRTRPSNKQLITDIESRVNGGYIGQSMDLHYGDSVLTVKWGTDAKRVLGFKSQNGAVGVMREALRTINKHKHYKEAIRWTIHDELIFELKDDNLIEEKVEELSNIMSQPLAELGNIGVGVEASVGYRWGELS